MQGLLMQPFEGFSLCICNVMYVYVCGGSRAACFCTCELLSRDSALLLLLTELRDNERSLKMLIFSKIDFEKI